MSHPEIATSNIAWNPSPEQLILLAGTERDIPSIALLLATLPVGSRGQVFIETELLAVPTEPDAGLPQLDAPGRFTVTWLDRSRGQDLRTSVDAWLSEMLPTSATTEHTVYAWVAADGPARVLSSD